MEFILDNINGKSHTKIVPNKTAQKGFVLTPQLILIALVAVIGIIFITKSIKFGQINPSNPSEVNMEALKEAPKTIEEAIETAQISEFEKQGFKFYSGNTPPNIEGTYELNTLVVSYEQGGIAGAYKVGEKVAYQTLTLSNQKPDGTITYLAREKDTGVDVTTKGIGAFITGSDNCFSILTPARSEDKDCTSDSIEVTSACITGGGLNNFQSGIIVTQKAGPKCETLVPTGYKRTFKEDDNFVIKM